MGNIAFVTDGIHESIDFDENSKINLISAKAPKQNTFDLSATGHISELQNKFNPRTQLQEDDVIISTVGTIGNCAVVDKSILPANSDRHVGIIRLNRKYKPRYVSTFLLSKYGKFQTERHTTGNVQPNLFIYKLKALKIPFISDIFQDIIENKVMQAQQELNNSKDLYFKAEEILLKELNMKDFKKSQDNIVIKSLSESFELSGRIDAEYYQKKYYDYENMIIKYGNYTRICDEFTLNKKKVVLNKKQYNYIEIGDINIGDGSFTYNNFEVSELPSNAQINVDIGDILVSKVRPYRGAVSIINKKIEDLIVSNAFTVLHSKGFYSTEVLYIILRTNIYKDWLLKWNVGTSYPVIKDDDILQMVIPLIPEELQKVISEKISKSNNCRLRAIKIFEIAKKAIEIAIEQDENAAIEWIQHN